jgi:hypothetical protein
MVPLGVRRPSVRPSLTFGILIKVWSQLAKLVSEEKVLNDFFLVEFSIFSNGAILVGSGIIGYNSERGPPKHHQSCQV